MNANTAAQIKEELLQDTTAAYVAKTTTLPTFSKFYAGRVDAVIASYCEKDNALYDELAFTDGAFENLRGSLLAELHEAFQGA